MVVAVQRIEDFAIDRVRVNVVRGLRIAAPLSLVGAIIVDLMGAQQGLGYLMLTALTFGPQQWPMLWASMVITLVLGFALARTVVLAERLLTPWQVGVRTRAQ